MKTLATAVLALLVAPTVFAGADCPANSRDQWIPEADMRARIEGEGIAIKTFKIDDNCYEVYGRDDQGRKVEIYYDTASGEVVKSEIDG